LGANRHRQAPRDARALADVEQTVREPEKIRRSRTDPSVYLFYGGERAGRWVCVVAKRADDHGFLVTSYPTDAIKEGEEVWSK
jgi:hypothetical protein